MYNAAVVGFNRRMTHGLQVQASYTYSHASDQGQSSTTFTATNNLVNPYALVFGAGPLHLRRPATGGGFGDLAAAVFP